jgi:pimeloyl-ACP methyl ester carboxylesterase
MNNSKGITSKKKIFWGFIIIVLAGALIWGVQWATYARPPLPEALEALVSDAIVEITQDPWLTFSPVKDPSSIGLVFYPGGRVDPRAYAPLLRAIAAEGYLVVVPEMPINMAVFNPNVADKIISYHPEIEHWVISGHSVGGTMAVQYTYKNPDIIKGLAIWASYPANGSDISDSGIPVLSIYGSREITVTDISVGERAHLLPEDTQYVRIEGGDHHQFGSYLIDPEDHLATISRESQQQQIIEATLGLLSRVH